MTVTYWKADLATGGLSKSADDLTYTAVAGIVWWKVGFIWDAPTGKSQITIFAKVQDAVSTDIVNAQGAGSFVLSSGYIPTREFRTAKTDVVHVLFNGVVAGTISPATGWPAGGAEWDAQFADSAFKEPI